MSPGDQSEPALQLLLRRVSATLEETGPAFPLYAEATSGSALKWVTTEDGNWCAGYWIGLLWLAAKNAKSKGERERYRRAAYDHLPALLAQPTNHLFAGLNHYYAGFLGFDVVSDPMLRDIGIRGADAMLALYNSKARQIPIGTYVTAPAHTSRTSRTPIDRSNFAAVDALHTSVPILWRAYAETKRPEYREVALAHTRRHLEWHVRDNGSTTQLTTFDPMTGERVSTFSTLAQSDTGCWSRGLGWNIAGLANVYVNTGDEAVLATLRRSTKYYVDHARSDLVPAWDLALSDPAAERDASAAAVMAYGLLLLGRRSGAQTEDLERLGLRVVELVA